VTFYHLGIVKQAGVVAERVEMVFEKSLWSGVWPGYVFDNQDYKVGAYFKCA
jgi:uncharacterized protein YjlB